MGCLNAKKQKPEDFVLKAYTPWDKAIQKKLTPLLELSNASNINNKYEHLMQYIENQYDG